ncbi:SNF2-related protein [Candidatus Palauibacter sp.]|uniref:SNF2-related protein n=1 Tax=Candidatus Palauibacter sp. TaxID=3101350 RepID=UPI003AF1ECF8
MTSPHSDETQGSLGIADSEADGPADAYEGLSPAGRLAAQAYGVVSPHDLGRKNMTLLLYDARFALRGRTFTQTEFMAATKEVHEAGIVYRPGPNTGLSAVPAWAPRLTIAAFEDGNLERIERQFTPAVAGRFPRVSEAGDIMRLRCHVVAGRFDALAHDLDEPEYRDWRWLVHPGAGQLLWRLPPPYVEEALADWLGLAIDVAAPSELAVKAWRECSRDPARHAADIAFIRVLEGRPEDALAVFDALPAEARDGKPARTGRAATRALLAMLRGDDEEAARFIAEAIAAERAGTRKRNVFPPLRAFTLSLLALVRSDTPANTASLERFLRIGQQQDAQPLFLEFVMDAAAVRSGEGVWAAPDGAPPFILRLFEGLLSCWLDSFEVFEEEERAEALLEFATRAATNGYRWLAAECCSALGRIQRLHARGGEAWREVPGLEAGLRAGLGPETLVSLIEPAEDWEYPLREIEKVAQGVRKKRGKAGKRSSPRAQRLAWVLGSGHFGETTFQPRQQVAGRNRKWSKGRAVALKRLAEQAGDMDFLTDQDRAVAAGILHSRDAWRGGPQYSLGMAGVYALAGHPHLFNEDGVRVDLVRRDPELLIEEEDGRLRVRIDPHREHDRGDYRFARVGDARYEVTRFGAAHKEMMDVIPAEGIELPVEARERLVGAVSGLAGEFRVQGTMDDEAEDEAGGRRVPADPHPWVRLAPRGAGLAVEVVVEPVPGSAAYFTPGTGGTSVFAHREGEAVRAERDLAAEAAAVRDLAAACPALAGLGPDYAMTVSGVAESLDLVEQLAAAEARSLWPEGESLRIVARADTPSLRLSVKSAGDWFRASGGIEFDEETSYDLRRLFEFMDRTPGSRFLEVGDGAYVALTRALRGALDDLRTFTAPFRGGLRLHPLAAPALSDLAERATLTADAAWRDRLGKWREAQAGEPETPGTLRGELRPYQVDGFRWLARLADLGAGACLADDMGLGKTVQALALLLRRAPDGPALVVAPTSVVANWFAEARRFAPTLNVATYDGPAADRKRRLEGLGAFDLVLATYGVLQVDAEKLAEVEWSTVVLDEAQAIKNPATKRARAARGLKAGFRLVTTGTPIQNNVLDLYSLFAFLSPGMLGSLNRFRRRFALPIERDGDAQARARLRRLTAPFILRRLKSDVLDDLPARTEITHHVELSPEEAALYEALRQRALEDLAAQSEDGTAPAQARMQVLAHLTRLRLACCNPALVAPGEAPPSSKMKAFAEILDELRRSGHKVLVFSQFVRHLRLIEDHLEQTGVPYQYLDGSTPAKSRAKRIAAFQAGLGDAFLISTRAGGVGLNLTAADYVIHMDPWWNPAVEDQASDRAHRIGQTRPVTIYRLVAKGTIEEQIVDLHRRKRDLADRLLEGADAPGRLDAGELIELLKRAV